VVTLQKQKVRLGFIGLGLRGINHLYNAINRNDVEVIAICDIDADRIKIAQDYLQEANYPKAKVFDKGDYDYRNLLEEKNN